MSEKRIVTLVVVSVFSGGLAGYLMGGRGTVTREAFRARGLKEEKAEYQFSKYTGYPKFAWTDDKWREAELSVFGSTWEYR